MVRRGAHALYSDLLEPQPPGEALPPEPQRRGAPCLGGDVTDLDESLPQPCSRVKNQKRQPHSGDRSQTGFLFSQTIRTEMSAGETPEMREACPMERG
jgi:hypothetical protein